MWGDGETSLAFEASPRSVRAMLAGEGVADSKRAMLLHETGHPPVYYFPIEDVRADLLEETEYETTCPYKGAARYWTVAVGDRREESAAWSYPQPLPGAPDLSGYVAFRWEAMDEWYEEDDRLVGGARDPYHRVDAVWSDRHVRVLLDGEVVAETRRPCLVFETGVPTRYYLAPGDVRIELASSRTSTACPYKGMASYWSATVGDRTVEDVAWSYENPPPEQPKIAGLLCFWPERVDAIEVDGGLAA
ncbi:MAG TPA: DUF427 domain-containing protein [Gaiellaceae bacterium]|nr:DUF427 domain-containing protein [Gaiellaceae bacterium]